MKDLMERASTGNRQAVLELYEKNWKGVTAVCVSCLGHSQEAYTTVVSAFDSAWSYLLNHCIKTEDEFRTTLYKQATILCRRSFVRKGMKGLAVPQNKNFVITRLKDTYSDKAAFLDNLLTMLPDINRYVFVLHRIAGFDEKMIGSITGYKKDVVKAALSAENQNTARTLEQLNQKTGLNIDLEKEILQYCENAQLPEKYQSQILSEIDRKIKPYEKKRLLQIVLYVTGALVGLALIGIIIASLNKKEAEITFTTKESTMEETETADSTEMTFDNSTEAEATEGTILFAEGQRYFADIEIENYGTITVELDYKTAPITVENFVTLAEEDFYDGLTFHRIIEGFMMQGGDPKGDGTGGSEKNISGEFTSNGYENDLSHVRGVISMARSSDYDSASSQFFIVHEDSTFLDGEYAAFGWVTEGMDIVDAICTEATPTDDNGTITAEQQPVISSIHIRVESENVSEE